MAKNWIISSTSLTFSAINCMKCRKIWHKIIGGIEGDYLPLRFVSKIHKNHIKMEEIQGGFQGERWTPLFFKPVRGERKKMKAMWWVGPASGPTWPLPLQGPIAIDLGGRYEGLPPRALTVATYPRQHGSKRRIHVDQLLTVIDCSGKMWNPTAKCDGGNKKVTFQEEEKSKPGQILLIVA